MTLLENHGFPQQVFAPMSREGRYTGTAACIHVLETARELMGLTKYQMGKVLGTANGSTVFHWLAGRRRPSSLFLTRLTQVLLMFHDGVPVYQISFIDWEKAKIHWRNGEVDDSSRGHLFKTRRSLSKESMQASRQVAFIPAQPQGQDGPHRQPG